MNLHGHIVLKFGCDSIYEAEYKFQSFLKSSHVNKDRYSTNGIVLKRGPL